MFKLQLFELQISEVQLFGLHCSNYDSVQFISLRKTLNKTFKLQVTIVFNMTVKITAIQFATVWIVLQLFELELRGGKLGPRGYDIESPPGELSKNV
jgi:hypothetical protein